jgi:hypothetical protein
MFLQITPNGTALGGVRIREVALLFVVREQEFESYREQGYQLKTREGFRTKAIPTDCSKCNPPQIQNKQEGKLNPAMIILHAIDAGAPIHASHALLPAFESIQALLAIVG